jgi:hypothetical protein
MLTYILLKFDYIFRDACVISMSVRYNDILEELFSSLIYVYDAIETFINQKNMQYIDVNFFLKIL